MKKIILFIILCISTVNAQVRCKIEGIIINSPCELEYTRNLGNQNNYSCVAQIEEGKIDNYSVTVQNLNSSMNGLNENSLKTYKSTFLKTAEINYKNAGETTKYLKLSNGIDAISSISYLTYQEQKFRVISITFLYKQKSFIVNLTTNKLNRDNEINNLINRIIFK